MKFSIIIPVYNSNEYLPKCLDSIISQDFSDYELILVDDGSTDDSLSVCNSYAEKHSQIKVISQKNAGPSAARNAGLATAMGEYVLFVDSDDWVDENYLNVLNKEAVNGCELIVFGIVHHRKDGDRKMVFPTSADCQTEKTIDYFCENYLKGDICSPVNKCYLRSKIEEKNLHFINGTVFEEDLQFVLSYIDVAESFKVIPDCLYVYNQRTSGSVTTRYNPNKFKSLVIAYENELKYANKWEKPKLAEIYHNNYLNHLSACINNLMYSACPLTSAEKKKEIKDYLTSAQSIKCISSFKPRSARSKMIYFFIKHRLVGLCYLIHWLISRIKGKK